MTGESTPLEESSPIFRVTLPNGEYRQRLASWLDLAYWSDDLASHYDYIPKGFGLEIVERTDKTRPHYRCVQYVFGTVKHEPWVREGEQFSREFLKDALEHLLRAGYKPISDKDSPRERDVVGYRNVPRDPNRKPSFLHFGVLVGEDLVESKFNDGHVFRHRINQVPSQFSGLDCGEAVFFRKST